MGIDEEKFFLEDPKKLLDQAINGYNYCPTIDFATATWGNVFHYSIDMRAKLRNDRFKDPLFSENATEFIKALAINAAQNCPLDIEVWGESPIWFAVDWNDVEAASALLRRGAVIEPDALARAIWYLYPAMVKILLENGADVHAETRFWGGEPMPIHELCAQGLQRVETEYERGTARRLDNLEKLREINKLVMDKKEKTDI